LSNQGLKELYEVAFPIVNKAMECMNPAMDCLLEAMDKKESITKILDECAAFSTTNVGETSSETTTSKTTWKLVTFNKDKFLM
jgi:hypothetical protein